MDTAVDTGADKIIHDGKKLISDSHQLQKLAVGICSLLCELKSAGHLVIKPASGQR